MKLLFVIALFGAPQFSFCAFEVPDALVEVFHPTGLRVSIPDQEGIKLFAFHAKVNEELNGREGGTFSRDIVKAKNGRWTFYDPYAELKVGDVIYYWTYVDYFDGRNKLGYTNDDQQFVVQELLPKEGSKPVTGKPITPQEDVTLKSGCKQSPTTLNNENVCVGQEIFNEDFTTLRNEVWSREIRFAGRPDYEFVLYTALDANLKINEGHLQIKPTPSEDLFGQGFVTEKRERNLGVNCTGIQGTTDCVQKPFAFLIIPPVASAQLTTKNKWSFKFGKITVRAKLPKGDWIYPELFLNPVNEEYGPGYTSGQIRIAFLPGNQALSSNLHGGCILGSTVAGRNYGIKNIKKIDGSWNDDFHTFTVIWKPDQITLSVDDQVYGNIYAPKGGFISEAHNLGLRNVDRWRTGSQFAPLDKEMFLTVGVGVGGHSFEDREDGTKPWVNNEAKSQKKFYKASSKWRPTWGKDSVLDIDYIKVWAL